MNYSRSCEGQTYERSWRFVNGVLTEVSTTTPWQLVGPDAPFWVQAHSESASENRSTEAKSSGTFTRTIKWISPWPAPDKVLVSVQALAFWGATPNGTGWAANGLGDAEIPGSGGYSVAGLSEGRHYRLLDVDPVTKEAQYTFSISAEAHSSEPSASLKAEVSTSIRLEEKAVGIEPWSIPNFRLIYTTPTQIDQEENKVIDPSIIRIDDVFDSSTFVYERNTILPILYGKWNMGTTSIVMEPYKPLSYPTPGYLFKEFSSAEVKAMIDGIPYEMTVTATATDMSDGQQRIGTARVFIHAPLESPKITSSERVYTDWTRISSEQILLPLETFTFTMTTGVVLSHTTTFTLTSQVGIEAAFLDLFKASAVQSASWSEGDTAEISESYATQTTWTNPNSYPVIAWKERRAFYRHTEGFALLYNSSGFTGELREFEFTSYESGTGQLAEQQDFTDQTEWEPYEV